MLSKTKKPYVIYIAEIIYSCVSIINMNFDSSDTFNKFMETDQFKKLSNGTLHDEWFIELKKNDYFWKIERIPDETIKLLEIQRDITIKQLIKIPELYIFENNTLIEASDRAHQFLWRMCESYELWCNETDQPEQLLLKIID